ncbi:hypothetical protein RQP46_007054 [Phenoliferia psychrophenolica]
MDSSTSSSALESVRQRTPPAPTPDASTTQADALAPAVSRPPRKRLVLEPSEDFLDAALLAEAELEGQDSRGEEEPPKDASPEVTADAPADAPRESNGASEDVEMLEEQVFVRRGVKEGKKRLVLVPDDDFAEQQHEDAGGGAADEDMRQVGPSDEATRRPAGSRVGPDYSSVNFSSRNAIAIEAAPIAATTFDGRKITFKRRKRVEGGGAGESAAMKKDNSIALTKLGQSMLEVPYHDMVKGIKAEIAKAKEGSDAIETDADAIIEPEHFAPLETSLWTDRYRPKKFTDLLGDERVHRAALLWLKEWDQCVFPKTSKTTAAAELKRERRKKRARDGKFGSAPPPEEELPGVGDAWGRPQEKILLMSGPPGLGKTTLAYVLAHQAGYDVFEVNASSDRGGGVVDTLIRGALEQKAMSMDAGMAKNKPTCVVIDEIDGAVGDGESGFINSLVKLITDGANVKRGKSGESTAKKAGEDKDKKAKKKIVHRALLRPIICICNDLYSPALRPLRPYARIIRFQPPTTAMIVTRLRNICAEEGLKADTKSLTLLTEIAEGDLRSCLNTLQFIKRRSPNVDAAAIQATSIGKDMATSSFAVIASLFKKPPRKKGAANDNDEKYVQRLVRDIGTSNEASGERLVSGIFENYLSAKQTNDSWPRILDALDWLDFHGQINSSVRGDQEFALYPYLAYAFPPFYKLFASHTAKRVENTKADYESHLQQQAHKEILDSFIHHLPHHVKFHFTSLTVATELLPQLNRIIAPDLKPVNSQLIKSQERAVMLKLVNTMITLGLYFVQSKNDEGQPTYKLDPPIDVFVHYEGKRAIDIAASRYAVRHMIANEMQVEDMRRSDGAATATTAEEILAAYKPKKEKDAVIAEADVKEAVDFFRRPIAVKPKTEEEELMPPPPKRAKQAVYRFHEGFSNAVRLTKRVADFL